MNILNFRIIDIFYKKRNLVGNEKFILTEDTKEVSSYKHGLFNDFYAVFGLWSW